LSSPTCEAPPTQGVNWSGCNLSGANLSGANLSNADLSNADLSNAGLWSANLRGANLYGANLSSADLSYTDLSYTDLSYTDLYVADLSQANLSQANLYGASSGIYSTVDSVTWDGARCPEGGIFAGDNQTFGACWEAKKGNEILENAAVLKAVYREDLAAGKISQAEYDRWISRFCVTRGVYCRRGLM
jgi:uncharacterized protein YjbI with pentapeptide repeats